MQWTRRAPTLQTLKTLKTLMASLALAGLAACGGGGSDSPTPPPADGRKSVDGTVAGLAAGQRVVLQNQGADDYAVGTNGPFVTAASWPLGSSYAISVKTQPTGQQCTVAQGTGTLGTAPTAVRVDCVTLAAGYTLGGTVSGVPGGQSVVLGGAGGEELTVAADGGFTFARPLADGAEYAVTVKTAPAGSGCVVRNGAGAVAAAAVDTVAVRCAPLAALPQGAWEQDNCQPTPGGGVRTLWNFAGGTGTSSLGAGVGTVTYRSDQCNGVGVAAQGELSRSFSFHQDRAEANAEFSAFWGRRQTFPGGFLAPPAWSQVVLVRKANHLCLLEDSGPPSAFPNVASLAADVNAAIAAGRCYTPR
ncbi:MAG: hypothetical protein V4679_12810 [Pseudomonadota bacterium]